MIENLEIEWKVSGLLPTPIGSDCNYYQRREDQNYSKRTFGRTDLEVSTYSLEPTKQFHQALNAELRERCNFNMATNRLPYTLPIGKWGDKSINFRFRVFGERFLVISIHVPSFALDLSVLDTIELEKLSSHPLLESIARFCFNVHYCHNPSQMLVKGWHCKPLMRITDKKHQVANSSLVEIVTRHQGIDQRAIAEMLDKNEALNFNDDLLLLDKQGVAFLQRSPDHNNQRNRYQRVSSLFEYSLYVKAFETALFELKGMPTLEQELELEIGKINGVLRADVLSQSVSAHRGWELLKIEMSLKAIELHGHKSDKPLKKGVIPFYKRPFFIGVSALTALISGLLAIYSSINGGE